MKTTMRLVIIVIVGAFVSYPSMLLAQALSAEDVKVLRDGAEKWEKDYGRNSEAIAARKLAASLGRRNSSEAIPVLVSIRNASLLSEFANNYTAPATPEVEALVERYLPDPVLGSVAANLIRQYKTRSLFDALHDVIVANPTSIDCFAYVSAILSTTLSGIEEDLLAILKLLNDRRAPCPAGEIAVFLAKRQYMPAEDEILKTFLRFQYQARDLAPGILHLGSQRVLDSVTEYIAVRGTAAPDEEVKSLLWTLETAPPKLKVDRTILSDERIARFGPSSRKAVYESLERRLDTERRAFEISPANFAHWLSGRDYFERVLYFVNNGADVNAVHAGIPPLHVAAENDNWEAIRVLLERDAHPNARGERHRTALHILAAKPSINGPFIHSVVSAARLVIAHGGDVSLQQEDGSVPIHGAARTGNVDMMDLLVHSGAGVDAVTKEGISPLHLAANSGKLDAVRWLVDKGAGINVAATDGRVPLHEAMAIGNVEIVRLLLQRGGEVNAKTRDGHTPLHYAMRSMNPDVIRLLIANRADLNATTEEGVTALHLAAMLKGNVSIVNLLVRNGALVNAKDSSGITALHKAAEVDDVAMIKLLVDSGADVNAEASRGFTPTDLAVLSRHEAAAVWLQAHGGRKNISRSRSN